MWQSRPCMHLKSEYFARCIPVIPASTLCHTVLKRISREKEKRNTRGTRISMQSNPRPVSPHPCIQPPSSTKTLRYACVHKVQDAHAIFSWDNWLLVLHMYTDACALDWSVSFHSAYLHCTYRSAKDGDVSRVSPLPGSTNVSARCWTWRGVLLLEGGILGFLEPTCPSVHK